MSYNNTENYGFLPAEGVRLLLLGGKGGVGKTTFAAAFSLHLADLFPQKRVLVVSTDPAHSLSDIFDYHLGATPAPVYDRANLDGLELDAERAFAQFRAKHGATLKKIVSRGTYLDEEDLDRLLRLSFPGLDEVMALIQILELKESLNYDLLIVDTAPTGHSLKLLSLPLLMESWLSFLNLLLEKHRYLSRVIGKGYRPDEADAFINSLTEDIRRLGRLLQDETICQMVPITLLETVVLAETKRLLQALAEMKIPVKNILVNRVIIEPGACNWCQWVADVQRDHLQMLERLWPGLRVTLFPSLPQEVRGEERLKLFLGQALSPTEIRDSEHVVPREFGAETGRGVAPTYPVKFDEGGRSRLQPEGFSLKACLDRDEIGPRVPIRAPKENRQFFLFCGKGGVGKTTLASSFALNLSRRSPGKRLLLFSTDPAHSLTDCLEQKIGDQVTLVHGAENLFAIEINPHELFAKFKQSYSEQVQEVFDGFVKQRGVDFRFDREVLTNLLDLSPPGIDELMALAELADYIDSGSYDLYVLDTAPTGHTVRFLELPQLIQEWLRAFFDILLKYRRVVRLSKTSELLVDMSKKVKMVQQALTDPERCEGIPVTIPTEAALSETCHLVLSLKEMNIPGQRLLVNMVALRARGCCYCDSLLREHGRMLARFRAVFPDLELIVLPQLAGEIKGTDALYNLLTLAG